MPDGNIILRCEGLECRVHRGVLTMDSPIFQRLLADQDALLAKASTADSAGSEGTSCLILILLDKAEDMLNLMNALYHRRSVSTQGHSFPTEFTNRPSFYRY